MAEPTPTDRATALAPHVAAAADAIEREQRIVEPVLTELLDAGLFRLLLPRAVGGADENPLEFLRVVETIAGADASTAWCLSQTSVCAMAGALLPLDVARTIFADPRAIIGWGFAPDARAVAVESGWRITGKWAFGSGTHHATWLGGTCAVPDDAGRPVMRMMLFPSADATMTDVWHVMGLRGTGSDAYAVTDLFVPHSHSIRLSGAPQPHAPGPLYLLPHDSLWAGGFACIALAVARAMLNALIAAAREKTPREFKRPLAETAAVQSLVARSDVQLRATRMFFFNSFEEIWAAVQATGRIDLDQRMTIRVAASHAIDEAEQVALATYRAIGATAVFSAQPFERRLRDMHMVTQHAHGRHSHYETVGQHLLGLTPDLAFL